MKNAYRGFMPEEYRSRGNTGSVTKYCSVRDVQQRVDRGSIQVVLMTYDLFS